MTTAIKLGLIYSQRAQCSNELGDNLLLPTNKVSWVGDLDHDYSRWEVASPLEHDQTK